MANYTSKRKYTKKEVAVKGTSKKVIAKKETLLNKAISWVKGLIK